MATASGTEDHPEAGDEGKRQLAGRQDGGRRSSKPTKLDGRFLWRINLGKNIREGAHYTQFLVYDLDGDGKAEVVCKTADGTVDGTGTPIGDANADHRNVDGFILEGPEFLTVFEGATGKALATTGYIPPRGRAADWGDDRGNRVDRFLAAVAYLDGSRPSVIMCRGYYTRTVLAAWNWRDGALSHAWTFDSDDGTPATGGIAAREPQPAARRRCRRRRAEDEIVYGACAIDDNAARGCTRRAWVTEMPSTSPTSIRTDRAWKPSTSTNALAIPTGPSSATRGPVP